ncbi:MAG: hypothetical protein D6743_09130 [Calditrichaeota bacterium]|nr:MAG: hypothetical protein D6743_09130 [Calditrichota bacterium]
MKSSYHSLLFLCCILAVPFFTTGRGQAKTKRRTMKLQDKTRMSYTVVLPEKYDKQRVYPILLALPPGPQTGEMVERGLDGFWREQAQSRGWIVVSPVAPHGKLFFQGSEAYLPEFLDKIAQEFPPEGGKFYLAGISNGGISAFRVALNWPERFHALLALPGFPADRDFQRLERLKQIPVAMFGGGEDVGWVVQMQQAQRRLKELNGHVTLKVFPGEGHLVRSLVGGKLLFDLLESFRRDTKKTSNP